jgi:hypothetical protein
MALANLIAYVVVFGLPLWLVAEELIHRFAARRSVEATAPARAVAPTAASADRERRSPERARAHASFV